MQVPDMKDFPIFKEITIERDRGAALIMAGFLDAKLTDAIKACLRSDKDYLTKLFKPDGPIGAFGTKVDLGYLLKLYRKETRRDLEAVVTIRNRFAHAPEPIDFSTKDIRELCDGLTLVKRVWGIIPDKKFHPRPLTQKAARHEFMETCSLALNMLDHQTKHENFRTRAEELLPY